MGLLVDWTWGGNNLELGSLSTVTFKTEKHREKKIF